MLLWITPTPQARSPKSAGFRLWINMAVTGA
jgi:hypothetical protein